MNYAKEAEARKDDFLLDLNKLVEIESTRDETTKAPGAPFGTNCRKVLDVMLDMGRKDGFTVKDADGYAGVIEYGDPDNPDTIGILGHLDIVPLGEGWTKDPLKVTEKDGYIFGRGVLDDKGPAMAAYYAMKMIRDAGIPLKKRIMFIAGCDEESGMECMDHYVKAGYEIPKTGFVPDAEFPVIYGEKGGAHITLEAPGSKAIKKMKTGSRINIVTGKADALVHSATPEQKKLFEFFLETNGLKGTVTDEKDGVLYHVEGESSHAAWPEKGVNAAAALLNFIGHAYDDQAAADVADMIRDYTGKYAGIQQTGMYMGPLTMNAGLMEAGPDAIKVHLDIRYPNETNGKELAEKMQEAADAKETPIKVVLDSDSKPLFVDPDSTLVQTLMDVYRTHTGDTYSPAITIGGGTYARKFDNFVSFGPELPHEKPCETQFVGGCHQKDEGVRLSDMLNAVAIYADAIVRLAS